jgi:hypothetical protein
MKTLSPIISLTLQSRNLLAKHVFSKSHLHFHALAQAAKKLPRNVMARCLHGMAPNALIILPYFLPLLVVILYTRKMIEPAIGRDNTCSQHNPAAFQNFIQRCKNVLYLKDRLKIYKEVCKQQMASACAVVSDSDLNLVLTAAICLCYGDKLRNVTQSLTHKPSLLYMLDI